MSPADIISVAAAGVSVAAIVLSVVDKLPFVQKNATLKTWIDDANDIAGELKQIVPMGSTPEQVRALAETKAAAVITKYSGGVTQAEFVTQIIGEFGRIITSGHVVPTNLLPVQGDILAELAKLQAMLAAQGAMPNPTPGQTPHVALAP